MKVSEFQDWLDAVEQLSADQRSVLRAALESSGDSVLQRIITARASKRQRCVRCGSDRVIGWGNAHGLPRFRCKDCRRTYNPLTGTSLAGLKKRARWGRHAESLGRGEVLREVAGACGVHISTAHRWRHRFLAATLSLPGARGERDRGSRRDVGPSIGERATTGPSKLGETPPSASFR